MIRTEINAAGRITTTHTEGEFTFVREGWTPWVVTHEPSGTKIETGHLALEEARRVAEAMNPGLAPVPAADQAPYDYTVVSRFSRRFSGHRGGAQ